METLTAPWFSVHLDNDARKLSPSWTSHEQAELQFVNRGTIRLMIGNKSYATEPGDILIIPPNKLHHIIPCGDGAFSVICVSIQAGIKSLLEEKGFSGGLSFLGDAAAQPVLRPQADEGAWFSALFLKLAEESAGLSGSQDAMICIMRLILVEIERFYAKSPGGVEEMEYDQPDVSRLIKNVIQYINRNFRQEIGLAQIAQEFWLNPSYLSRQFKSNVGMTITEFVTDRRVDCAKGMLHDRDMSISDIAMESGFNNISYFNAVFKKWTGLTPGDYRKQRQEKENRLPNEFTALPGKRRRNET